mmetsp:Transcript_36959/g.86620  ORF Transcript_36959/g.86620 Transcript_36959/m.86620 type:complete len:185 (+) Transcript_36959:121-675(+)|eukprot:CAMPEP_0178445398 /NCGR_PEP_ID=MMETSP0689_2-20121128/40129_1 /TAXON_ID=160604 /ORGANISM="Amphidinium massartii, Strain CS-259" /LENGTH=184 /DNA_ID=CAMNT_0020069913 /DNA_START=46 /DNA_END=600 /DNA_ORIENTATION=-
MAPANTVAAVEPVNFKPAAGSEEASLKPARAKRADSPAQQRAPKPAPENKENVTQNVMPKKAEATSSKPDVAPAAAAKSSHARAKMALRVVLSLAVVACLVYFASQMPMEYVEAARNKAVSMMEPVTGHHLKLALGGAGLVSLGLALLRFRSAILAATGKAVSKSKDIVRAAAKKCTRTSKKEA